MFNWDKICLDVVKYKEQNDISIGNTAKIFNVNCGTLLKELSLRKYKVKRKKVKKTKEWSLKIGKAVNKYNKINWNNLIKEFIERRNKNLTLTKSEYCKEKNITKQYFLRALRERNIKIPNAKVERTEKWKENISKSRKGKNFNPKGSNGKLKGKFWNDEQKINLRIAKENSLKFQNSLKDPKKYEKARNTLLKNYSNWRERMEQDGKWLPLEKLSEWGRYKFEVGKWTKRNDLTKLKNYKKQNYQLDHIFSKKEGFLQKIEPKIIGNIINLRYIKAFDNNSKGIKCDITKEKLLELYSKH